ncbi:MAG: hypothetical protein LBB83_03150 [Treponema sp.]|jgi:hypothetical protein|nr:hypothetical protein [Treponema sp.]
MYFSSPGPSNTRAVMEIAAAEAVKRGISAIVAASNTGKTVEVLLEETRRAGYTGALVCVSHVNGFVQNGENELDAAIRGRLEDAGVRICTAAHALSGTERGISRKFQGAYPVEIIAHTLRMLGQGTKVCVEIAAMALDGGYINYGRPVIAVGGSGKGADTAVILSPGYSHSVFETRVHEILCKPDLS